jgi:hypothetical protein
VTKEERYAMTAWNPEHLEKLEGGSAFGARQASLEVADGPAKETRCEKARAQRSRPILTDRRKLT